MRLLYKMLLMKYWRLLNRVLQEIPGSAAISFIDYNVIIQYVLFGPSQQDRERIHPGIIDVQRRIIFLFMP